MAGSNELGPIAFASQGLARELLEAAMVQQASEVAAARARASVRPRPASNLPALVAGVGSHVRNLVEVPGRAMSEGITTERALPWGRDVALNMLGVGGPASMVHGGLGSTGSKLPGPVYAPPPSLGTGVPTVGDELAAAMKAIEEVLGPLPSAKPAGVMDELEKELALLVKEIKPSALEQKPVPRLSLEELAADQGPMGFYLADVMKAQKLHSASEAFKANKKYFTYEDDLPKWEQAAKMLDEKLNTQKQGWLFEKEGPKLGEGELGHEVAPGIFKLTKGALAGKFEVHAGGVTTHVDSLKAAEQFVVKQAGQVVPLQASDLRLTKTMEEGDFFIHGPSGEDMGQITKMENGAFVLETPDGQKAIFNNLEDAHADAVIWNNIIKQEKLETEQVNATLAMLEKHPGSEIVDLDYVLPKPGRAPNAQFPRIHPDFEFGAVSEVMREADRVSGGYTTPAFRGVSKSPRQEPKLQRTEESYSSQYYSTENARLADKYAREYRTGSERLPQVQPLVLKTDNYLVWDAEGRQWDAVNQQAIREARKQGKAGVVMQNVLDEPHSTRQLGPQIVYITLDPSTVRSRFARFDPSNWGKNDLLGSFGGAAVVAGTSSRGEDSK